MIASSADAPALADGPAPPYNCAAALLAAAALYLITATIAWFWLRPRRRQPSLVLRRSRR